MHRGLARGGAFFFPLPGEFDDQDGILGRKTNQNNEADLRQDVDGHAARKQPGDRREQAHRHDQHDGERQLPAFVLRDKYEKDEERCGPEDEKRRRAALLLLVREIGPFKGNALRQHLVRELLHAMQGRAGGDARRRYPLYLGRRKRL